jgi:glutamine amidotransferase
VTGPRPRVAVLDYGIGNLRSAQKALQRVGADAALTADHDEIAAADSLVIAGVGAFGRCMEALRSAGMEALTVEAAGRRPLLGICVGMQMLYDGSEEAPGVRGLGILGGTVRLLPDGVKRPQMQWNLLQLEAPDDPLLQGLPPEPWVYFVHSYTPDDLGRAIATCDYGGPVVAAVAEGNVWATQFHPEKSAANGLRVLQNFVAISERARVA